MNTALQQIDMVKHFIQQISGKRANRLFLIAGLLLTVYSLYQLVRTAIYVHESVRVTATVTDVVTRPFESTGEAFKHGNIALGGTPSYQAIVRYTLPSGIVIDRMMTDADDTDYTVNQQVEVITPALDPSQAHIHKWKFIWGWECMQLGTGVILLLAGLVLRERTHTPAQKKASRKSASGRKKKTSVESARKRSPRNKK